MSTALPVTELELRYVRPKRCDRTEHFYEGAEGELVLCEDRIRYPDGHHEQRIEVELVEGSEKLLKEAGKEMQAAFPKIKTARRGKRSEARRRLAGLLGA